MYWANQLSPKTQILLTQMRFCNRATVNCCNANFPLPCAPATYTWAYTTNHIQQMFTEKVAVSPVICQSPEAI